MNRVIRLKGLNSGTNTIPSGDTSVPICLEDIRPKDGFSSSHPVAIQFLATSGLAGTVQVCNQDGSLTLTASASWSTATDLSLYTSGGSCVLVAPFTHLRLNVTAGTTEAIIRV